MKARIFIGSSSEALDIAYAIQENLEDCSDPTVWTQSIFEHTKSSLDSLVACLDRFDFGVFVFASDDVVRIRDQQSPVPRDNVIFELGLFIGRLGCGRCFFVVPRGDEDLHIPSDLLGITPLTFKPNRDDGNWKAALGPACNEIRKAVSPSRVAEASHGKALPLIEEALLATVYKLYFRDERAKIMRFLPGGQISDGKNNNEHTWRIIDGKLELLNGSGAIHSRFTFDPTSKSFYIESSSEIVCPYKQRMEPLK